MDDRSSWEKFEDWLTDSGPDILTTIGVLLVVYLVFRLIFPRIARAAIMRGSHFVDEETERRARTIIDVVDRTIGVAIILLAVITILPEAGVNITAIVTGVGIGGLALALGSQTLVRDAINGIFLLAEDQYRTGDLVRIADVTGTVEAVTLRRTIVRDDDGVVHSVPNGSISVVSNYTRDFAQVNIPVEVSHGEDVARVSSVVERVGRELGAEADFRDEILEAPRTTGVESVGDRGIVVMVSARTRPSARRDISSQLRSRLLTAFLEEGIRTPFSPPTSDGGRAEP